LVLVSLAVAPHREQFPQALGIWPVGLVHVGDPPGSLDRDAARPQIAECADGSGTPANGSSIDAPVPEQSFGAGPPWHQAIDRENRA